MNGFGLENIPAYMACSKLGEERLPVRKALLSIDYQTDG